MTEEQRAKAAAKRAAKAKKAQEKTSKKSKSSMFGRGTAAIRAYFNARRAADGSLHIASVLSPFSRRGEAITASDDSADEAGAGSNFHEFMARTLELLGSGGARRKPKIAKVRCGLAALRKGPGHYLPSLFPSFPLSLFPSFPLSLFPSFPLFLSLSFTAAPFLALLAGHSRFLARTNGSEGTGIHHHQGERHSPLPSGALHLLTPFPLLSRCFPLRRYVCSASIECVQTPWRR